ncbi:MAG: hypothetical protein RMM17_04360 [Acidobacteriota bacterium]|nr:hypothetical protein [Blastocatellia bacterium]MDW8411895.1 hypothetical protein [Acidobacteriota bacterium]
MKVKNSVFKLDSKCLPKREEALAKLDAWLTECALLQNNNKTSAAARQLGISRIWMNKLKKRYINS